MPRPNIVLIMTDQQRWDTLGCYGYGHMRTPHIDRLAARGAAFNHAFVQGAVCGPSRNSIVSSLYVHTHGIEQNERWLGPEMPNWIERLRQGGYHTANIGKMHTFPIRLPCGFERRTVVENKNYQQGQHGPDPDDYDLYLAAHGLKRPAQRYYKTDPDWPDKLQATLWPHADEHYPDHFVGRLSVDLVREHDFDQKPLFLWAGFAGPHDPFDVTGEYLRLYDDVEVPEPARRDGELDDKPPEQRRSMEGMDGKASPAAVWWSRATPERVRRMRRHYYANISLIDAWVGRLVEAVERRGQLDNTLFVFTSDHGDCLGDHDLVYKFSSHYDPVARVPLVFAGPGVRRQGINEEMVELIDLGPTLLDAAGLEPLEGANGQAVHGRSAAPLLQNEGAGRDIVFSEHNPRIMARTREWKLVFYTGKPYGELYDLRNDPDELYNLYDDPAHRETRGQLQERMLHWYGETRMRR